MTRYLGIDPGTTRIGFGVVEERSGSLFPVSWGIISHAGKPVSDAASVAAGLRELIRVYTPDVAGVERLFFMNNQKTAMAVAEMRGVLVFTLREAAVPVLEFTPQQVKLTVCGHGRANKRQMQDMVALLLNIKDPITPDDAADGLALALCCATTKSY